jgi:hypothetical protein
MGDSSPSLSIYGRFFSGALGQMLSPKEFKVFKFSISPKEIQSYISASYQIGFREQGTINQAIFNNVIIVDRFDNIISTF